MKLDINLPENSLKIAIPAVGALGAVAALGDLALFLVLLPLARPQLLAAPDAVR